MWFWLTSVMHVLPQVYISIQCLSCLFIIFNYAYCYFVVVEIEFQKVKLLRHVYFTNTQINEFRCCYQ